MVKLCKQREGKAGALRANAPINKNIEVMMYKIRALILAFTFSSLAAQAQDSTIFYRRAYATIDSMLVGKTPLNFKRAVLAAENAYFDGQLNYVKIEGVIESLVNLVRVTAESNHLTYSESDKDIVQMHAAIFSVLTDTIPIMLDSTHIIIHPPYTYDFNDMWGQKDWSKMFVSKLLIAGKGNCHSMPYLYKIIAEEFQIPTYLAFAPNHIYIKLRSKKLGWYNTELTSATFPVDAWIMASGYVHLDAIRNGLYMDTLSLQQSVAYTLLDLAQSFQHKFGKATPDFVLKCCDVVLKYHPANVSAMLTKAEAQKKYIETAMKARKLSNPKDLFTDRAMKAMYTDMEQTYVHLHQLGYRRMPEEMYVAWMGMLKKEPEKYLDGKVIRKFDNR